MLMDRRLVVLISFVLLCRISAFSSERHGHSAAKDVSDLYSSNARAREEAAGRLMAIGPRVIPLLVPVVCNRSKPQFDVAWPIAARVLGELRAEAATPCLIELLMYQYPSTGPVAIKTDETLANVDPAFKALIRIGEPAVPAIGNRLPFLGPDPAIMALRVLRAINTPAAQEAAEAYIRVLKDQIRFADQVLQAFEQRPGG